MMENSFRGHEVVIMNSAECKGFKAAGVPAGIKKKSDRKDLGLIFSEVPAGAAAVFTRNRVQAAPVMLDKERIKRGLCQALIVNAGNANCCTGAQGLQDAKAMAAAAAHRLGIDEDLVLVASTGVIGNPLPLDRIERAVPKLVDSLTPEGFPDLARAIMTTDTVPKLIARRGELHGKAYTMVGVAKGAGMIRPDMATMLCFICTDLAVEPAWLHQALVASTAQSFNRITIDGDTSTNDTVLLLANGRSGAKVENRADLKAFQRALDDVTLHLAKALVRDGEGVTKLVEIKVMGASNDQDARIIADTIAHSNLVKTAFFGEDANWGRILAAAGRAGVPIEPESTDIFFNDVLMVKDGLRCGDEAESKATEVLKRPEFAVTLRMKKGTGSASVLTCDFSVDYVKINADYRT
jgi:glutamate N-acetyltransferase/amino-acid N-acetyltransferase